MKLYISVGLSILFLFLCSTFCAGQELTIADKVPNIKLVDNRNEKMGSFMLSDIKAKLIIFDFWGTGSTSCIKAFPKIDSLQRKFGNEIQFILVNKESVDSTKRFFEKRKQIKPPDVPMVMGDTMLDGLFPHLFMPHHVWIDSTKSIKYITDAFNATENTISSFLNGADVNLSFKVDKTIYGDPLVGKIPNWTENVIYYSGLSHCISGLDIGNAVESTVGAKDPNRISRNCSSVLQLFQTAFAEGDKYNFDPGNTIILEVKDKWKFTSPENKDEYGKWLNSNAYYYELVVPPSRSNNLYKIMQEDLLRYFDVDVRVEKRKIKCLLFVAFGELTKLRTKGGSPAINFFSMTGDSLRYMYNVPFETLNGWIMRLAIGTGLETPIIGLVKFKGNVDFEMPTTSNNTNEVDLHSIRNALRKYNLGIIERYYTTAVLVIRDKKRKPN